MTGVQWVGVVLTVVCFGWLTGDAIRLFRRQAARRRSWSRHVDRALQLASRHVDRDANVVSLREWR